MKLHLPKLLLTAVMAACVSPAFAAYTTIEDQTFAEGQIPTYQGSDFSHLLYDNNQSDGRVISNANIDVRYSDDNNNENDALWVGPGNTNNTHDTARKPTLVRLDGKISGAGTLKFNEYPSSDANFVIYELTNSSSTFTGNINLENGHGTHADVQLNLNGVDKALQSSIIHSNGTAPAIINLLSSAGIKGLTGSKSRITSSSVDNVLTLNNAAGVTNSYSGTLGSGTYHAYTLEESSTTFANATSTAISLKKLGEGTQTFNGAANLHNVTVEAGTLNLNGATTLGGAVTVTGGALNIVNLLVTKEINADDFSVDEGASFNISKFGLGENHQLSLKEGVEATSFYTMDGSTASTNGYKAIQGTYLLSKEHVFEGAGYTQLSYDETNTYLEAVTINYTQFYINEGTVAVTDAVYASTPTFTVSSGATLDLSGRDFAGKSITLNEGATLTNTGGAFGDNARQIDKITLEGSAEVNIGDGHGHGLTAHGWEESYLELGSNTLTKTGSGLFRLVNTTVSGTGTIDVQGGTLYIGATSDGAGDRNVRASGVTFKTTAGSTIQLVGGADLTAKAVVGDGGKITGTGGTVLTVESAEKHTYGGSVEGALSLYKNGTGTMELSGANTYSGGTTINAGTVKASNDSALGTGAVSVKAGANLELGKDLEVSDLTITEGGSLIFGNGTTLTVTGTLTLDASSIKFAEGFNFSTDEAMILATARTLDVTGLDSWKGAYTIDGKDYTAGLSAEENVLSLTLTEVLPPSTGPITTTVTGDPSFADGVLTLKVTVEDGVILSSDDMVLVNILTPEIMDKILGAVGDTEFFGVTLLNGETTIVGAANGNVGFLSDNGCYYGEQVQLGDGNVAWQYSVNQIPEPASATLSLAALMMLCARRRRRA